MTFFLRGPWGRGSMSVEVYPAWTLGKGCYSRLRRQAQAQSHQEGGTAPPPMRGLRSPNQSPCGMTQQK